LQAQSTILFVALAAFVLAALFAERRESEAQIVREQNKLQTTLQQRSAEIAHINRYSMAGELAAALAHELNQPLGAIAVNAETAELMVKSPDPDLNELADILADIRRDDARAGERVAEPSKRDHLSPSISTSMRLSTRPNDFLPR
jgi:C4-dicarboxylate-specific signal transduction histidine kinase